MTLASHSGAKSRLYVSGAAEATAGVVTTLNKSFYPNDGWDIKRPQAEEVDDVVSGYDEPASRTVTGYSAEGTVSMPLHPDVAAWAFKMLFGAAPSSALVSPSSTVYEHTQNAWTAPPSTFTAFVKRSDVSTYTETHGGLGVKSIAIKSGKGKIGIDIPLVGLGVLTLGGVEPEVTPSAPTSEAYLLGVSSQLKVDGTLVNQGVLQMGWSLSIDPAHELLDSAGSTDGTQQRFDQAPKGQRKYTADVELIVEGRTYLDDIIAQTYRTWEFLCNGPIIDTPNSIRSLVAIQLTKARPVVAPEIPLSKGLFLQKLKIEGNVNTSTGYGIITRVRNLVASY
jgi:hypothetical protein